MKTTVQSDEQEQRKALTAYAETTYGFDSTVAARLGFIKWLASANALDCLKNPRYAKEDDDDT